MNCGDRRLIILASVVIAAGMIALVALLSFKDKPVPSEIWTTLGGISTGLFAIFSQQRPAAQGDGQKDEAL